ncbi:MAG: RpiB/LacA/LacB family sugar-phosphate isomerase [Chloroflexi bacterium]|nr:RpiB/LacA/LacB family sugar-phosphate isomerase [Chloroflexota bacterium]
MRIAVGSDERTPLADLVIENLKKRGVSVCLHGALQEGEDANWPVVAERVALEVSQGVADQGVLFCWTGTGVSIAANKVSGARAALCDDAATAAGARRWNDANILCLGLRRTSLGVAEEILDAWFAAGPDESEKTNIARLVAMDRDRLGLGGRVS